jgi:hypothetical protein
VRKADNLVTICEPIVWTVLAVQHLTTLYTSTAGYRDNFTFTIYIYLYIYSVALSPRANYTVWATATCRRNLLPTFVDRGVSRGQRVGSPTVVNLSFIDWSRYPVHTSQETTYVSATEPSLLMLCKI